MTVQESLPFEASTVMKCYRADHLLVADMVESGSKVLDVAAVKATFCNCWNRAVSMAAASNCRAKASIAAWRAALRWYKAMLIPTSPNIPTTPLTM